MASRNANLLINVIAGSVSVANKAGQIAREILAKGDLGIVEKGVNDLQTQADRSAQACIVKSLSTMFPTLTIIGEETLDPNEKCNEDWIVKDLDADVLKVDCPKDYANAKDDDFVVWVDPLDGTAEYTQGLLDHVTVLIGVAINGVAVAGIIHQPFYNYQNESDYTKLGRTMWGLIGAGAFGLKRESPPDNKRIVATTRSHGNKVINDAVDAVKPDEVLRVGGAGHKVLLIIEGRAHAYVFASPGCKKWDTCAPEAILHSVGGKLTDMLGNDLKYDKNVQHLNAVGVLATYDSTSHSWYKEQVPQSVKDALTATKKSKV